MKCQYLEKYVNLKTSSKLLKFDMKNCPSLLKKPPKPPLYFNNTLNCIKYDKISFAKKLSLLLFATFGLCCCYKDIVSVYWLIYYF